MANRADKTIIESFSRGAELWVHQARLFAVAIWTVLLLSILAGLLAASFAIYKMTTPVERYALERYVLAQTRDTLYMTAAKMELQINGEPQQFAVHEVIELTLALANEAWRKIKNGLLIGLVCGLGFLVALAFLWWRYGKAKMTDIRLRGAALVEANDLRKMMEARDDCSPYSIANVPIRKNAESLHTMIGGAQGTGKSQQFFALMKQVRARGKRAITPAPEKVVAALAAQSGQISVPHGASAANALGLTQQVPICEVYLTSGRTRTLTLGRSEVLIKHAPHWMLALGIGPAGAAVRALAWMGPTHADTSLATLHRTLPAAEWHALIGARGALPSWLAQAIDAEATHD